MYFQDDSFCYFFASNILEMCIMYIKTLELLFNIYLLHVSHIYIVKYEW